MASRIEDYALIGNTRAAALVGRDGSIDWFCAPRFDSPACFAALLGTPEHGRWLLAPRQKPRTIRRRYRDGTLIVETEFRIGSGTVRVIDAMPLWPERTDVVRVVECIRGRVPMRMELILRCGYGVVTPWVRRVEGTLLATAGPDSFELRSTVETHGVGFTTVANFTLRRGGRASFVLSYFPSHLPRPLPIDPDAAIDATERTWRAWCARCAYRGRWAEAVVRSLITLPAAWSRPPPPRYPSGLAARATGTTASVGRAMRR